MHARSAVFDLYGDHLVEWDYWAPIAAVVALAQSCGVQAPATRTAVTRLVTQQWLLRQPRHAQRGYAATPAARDRLTRARERIYQPGPAAWDGQWHVVVVETPGQRSNRDRLGSSLGYLGYGRLAPATWIGPRPNPELSGALAALGVGHTEVLGPSGQDPVTLVPRVWDLVDLAAGYRRFVAATPGRDEAARLAPEQAYQVRTALVHRWRTFMFEDPGLPREVLPRDWPEQAARELFLELADVLLPAARRFVTTTLAEAGVTARAGGPHE